MILLVNQIAEKSKFFIVNDPFGLILTLIAVLVVFTSLALIYIFFHNFGKQEEALKIELSHSGELNAAIALALHLYHSQIHDVESFKITINKVSKTYSPWSSKIYGLRRFPKNYWK